MKAITTTLYVCGGLMIAAAVLGAVDYTSASHKGILSKLYKEEKPVPVVADKEIGVEDYSRGEINPSVETAVVKAPEKKVEKKAIAKVARKKKKITYKEFSRKAIPDEIVMVDSVIVKK